MQNQELSLRSRIDDLEKKLTAQDRELGIEAALEKVRARAMAMHKSDELREVVATVFQQMKKLGYELKLCNILLFDPITEEPDYWLSLDEQEVLPESYHVPHFDHPFYQYQLSTWKTAKPFAAFELSGEMKKSWDELITTQSDVKKIDASIKDMMLKLERIIVSSVAIKNGLLQVISLEHLSNDNISILQRFARVFEQSYIRFLDLQKSEAQAREAQIQLALERVRARTMAMHKSEELAETAHVLFQQLIELGGFPDRISIGIADEPNAVVNFWLTDQQGSHLNHSFTARLNERTTIAKTYQAWKEQKKSLVVDLHGEELKEWIQFAREEMGIAVKDDQIKDRRVHSLAFFSHGWILVTSHEPQSTETIQILERFASVFNLTYRRFLDLQKAEAQAREAQIETALEKVRSRSLAMHKSEEIKDVVRTVVEKITELNIEMNGGVSLVTFSPESKDLLHWLWIPEQLSETFKAHLPYFDHIIYRDCDEARQNGLELIAKVYAGKEKDEYFNHIFKYSGFKDGPEDVKAWVMQQPYFGFSFAIQKHSGIFLNDYTGKLFSAETNEILKRFSKVFEQSYIRFLDLQKAEAQAREAQIETALERVRSASMAMHSSDDLHKVIRVLTDQLSVLGFHFHTANFITNDSLPDWEIWISSPGVNNVPPRIHVPYMDHILFNERNDAMAAAKEFLTVSLNKAEKDIFFHYLFENMGATTIPADRKEWVYQQKGMGLTTVLMKNISLSVINYDGMLYTADENEVIKRLTNVFEQSYTRFLDLQKAEAQAREAQIEAALERVRSRSMAMHKSDDLHEVIKVVTEQLSVLRLKFNLANFAKIDPDGSWDLWLSTPEQTYPALIHVPYFDHPIFNDITEQVAKNNDFYTHVYTLEESNIFFHHFFENTIAKNSPEERKQFVYSSKGFTRSLFLTKNIWFSVSRYDTTPFTNKENAIFKRFANVFEQAYTRFLDLQKAEAQARESQIQLALERVRARAMAMHRSDELSDVLTVLFEQYDVLEIDPVYVDLSIFDLSSNTFTWRCTGKAGLRVIAEQVIDLDSMEIWKDAVEKWRAGETHQVVELFFPKEVLPRVFELFSEIRSKIPKEAIFTEQDFPDGLYTTQGFCRFGALGFGHNRKATEEEKTIAAKIATEFERLYQRFLDLQKAEAQAREAQVEAALERVRGQVMAMRSPEDLNETIKVFYHQLESLNLTPGRCGVGLLNKENRTAELSTMNTTIDGQSIELTGTLDMTTHPVLEGVYNGWLKQKEYQPVLRGNEIKEYYKILRPQIDFPDYPDDAGQYGYFFFFDEGGLYAWTEKQMEEAELQIYRRFTSVLSLTYKRYQDLKQAEANAKEAVKQAALDRIRADIASMRSVSDLDRITPLIWNELTILGIPFMRCGVFIMDDAQQLIHTFLSAPDGRAIAAFHMPYDTPGNLGKVLSHWQEKKNYTDHWSENEFMGLADVLVKQGSIANREEYLASLPHGGFYLHFLPFLQGMLYVGNTTQLGEEEIKLLQSVADAFSTAYARYEDFKKLEAAKQQVDKTLVDLKQAQTQLVQSEKMASLGELTAGIAHEIQNPLNFVNNFSEVNKEMIDELQTELKAGNIEEAVAISNDIRDNEEKINHHGKRADSIVKGMLQHSRSSAGVKEPTDINKLADEYLRLAYHGLRAKDKIFNTEIKTDFDNNIGKINIVPQDIGRVLLNLFNNAFYAINERLRNPHPLKGGTEYKPIVSVITKRTNSPSGDGGVEISVADNGNGIAQNIVDKIFQPFFTTKPTGQGTGLGLSLAYDIIKAHGGEIKVETQEGVGSEFVVQLRNTTNQ